MSRILAVVFLFCLQLVSCKLDDFQSERRNEIMFIGIDVSGSFTKTDLFKDGVSFLSHYIHGHLSNKGNLSNLKDLYVGGIGGNQKEEPQSFFPIHDFAGKTPEEIEKKLKLEFANQKDNLTDFNTFFERTKTIVKQKNLTLLPLSMVLLTDGVPEIEGDKSKKAVKQAYSKIDMSPLENLTKEVTLRMLYIGPKVGFNWRNYVPTNKIRVWTVEPKVMYGWKEQLKRNGQEGLWKWIGDNIDLKVRSRGI